MATGVSTTVVILLALFVLIGMVMATPTETLYDDSQPEIILEPEAVVQRQKKSEQKRFGRFKAKPASADDSLWNRNSDQQEHETLESPTPLAAEYQEFEQKRSSNRKLDDRMFFSYKLLQETAWERRQKMSKPLETTEYADFLLEPKLEERGAIASEEEGSSASVAAVEEGSCDTQACVSGAASESIMVDPAAAETSIPMTRSTMYSNTGLFTFGLGAIMFVASPLFTDFILTYYLLGWTFGVYLPACVTMLQLKIVFWSFLIAVCFVHLLTRWEQVFSSEGRLFAPHSTTLRINLRLLSLVFLGQSFEAPEVQMLAVGVGLVVMAALEVMQYGREGEDCDFEGEEEEDAATHALRLHAREFLTTEEGILSRWARESQVSSFHWSGTKHVQGPERIHLRSFACTKDALDSLFSTPEFYFWKKRAAKSLFAPSCRKERSFQEIQATAFM